MKGVAFLLILAGGVLTMAGLVVTYVALRAVDEARNAQRRLLQDPSLQRRQLPMNAGQYWLGIPEAEWDASVVKDYLRNELRVTDMMITRAYEQLLEPLAETGAAKLGGALLALGVAAQTVGGLLAL